MHFKTNNTIKKILSCTFCLALALTVLSPLSVNASETVVSGEASYDLEKGGTQEFVLQNVDGTTAFVTVTEVPGNSRVSNGTYKISYKVPLVWEAGFYVDITTNQIKSAYSPYYTLFTGSMKSTRLTRESTAQASYYLAYNVGILTNSSGVRANISGTTLSVSKI